MNNNVYYSSTCFNVSKFDELIKLATQSQIFNLELSGNLLFEPQIEEKLKNLSQFKLLIHNYFPRPEQDFVLNLASNDQRIRQMSIDHCLQAIKICQDLNIPFYSIHSGFLTNLQPSDLGNKQTEKGFFDREEGIMLFKQSIRQLLKYIDKSKAIDLLVENNVCSQENLIIGENKLYLLADLKETQSFFETMKNPSLNLLVDLGHLNVSSQQLNFDKFAFIEKMADRIKTFHLSSNDGISDQGNIFTEDEWFMNVLKDIKWSDTVKILEIDNKNAPDKVIKCGQILDNL